MDRRELLGAFGFAATAWLAAAGWSPTVRAESPQIPVVGFLHSAQRLSNAHIVAAFQQGLGETGHVVGRNVAMEYRWAEGLRTISLRDDHPRLQPLQAARERASK